jgi:3-isopropylmalate/(R)-2-methylmalate dehydratase large subunit
MQKTIAEQIFIEKCADPRLQAGSFVFAEPDYAMCPEGTFVLAQKAFEDLGVPVKHPGRLLLIQDHAVPAKDIAAATRSKAMRDFACRHAISHHYDIGRGGICHHVVMDSGLLRPGMLVVGADSHTCTYGALGVFSTGVGSTDLAAVMATGRLWFRVPKSIKVVLRGTLRPHVQGKDAALALISKLGTDGATYMSLEFAGEGMASLCMADRISMCNMAVEAGSKSALFEVDDVTRDFLKCTGEQSQQGYRTGEDRAYCRVLPLDLSEVEPLVAAPHLPSNVTKADSLSEVRIDQAFIGSCTNGRIEDMRAAASVLAGRKVHPYVRLIVIPGTQQIYRQMAREGLLDIFLDAGAVIGPPTCGPCLGDHMGVIADEEVCISTTNRNFIGRMGSAKGFVYLASPWVAAASAVRGSICIPEQLSADGCAERRG